MRFDSLMVPPFADEPERHRRKLLIGVFLLCLALPCSASPEAKPQRAVPGSDSTQGTCGSADPALTDEQQRSVTEIASRGGGQLALFAGPSGTGKTLAASAIAAEMGVEVYRIDSARVVSKYIGETEKNLAQILDRAEELGAILLFDEADALFGKRSGVTDAHDRYANIEVSYLLQRMEAYRGIVILASNSSQRIDPAILRRVAQIVEFAEPSWEGCRD